MKHSKVWMGKIFVFLHNCAPTHWSVLEATSCQAQYFGALTSFIRLLGSHHKMYVLPWTNDWLKDFCQAHAGSSGGL